MFDVDRTVMIFTLFLGIVIICCIFLYTRNQKILADQSNVISLLTKPWKYPHSNDTQHIVTVTSITPSMILLQPELISNKYKTKHGITKGGRVVEANWLHIYSYLQPSYFTRLGLKCLCRLFNDVEKMITLNPNCSPLEPIPLYTSFPHSNYASLRGLTTCLSALSKKETGDVPSLLLIADGEHIQLKFIKMNMVMIVII